MTRIILLTGILALGIAACEPETPTGLQTELGLASRSTRTYTPTLNPVGGGCCATPEHINPAGEIVGPSDLEPELEMATLWSRR